MDVTPDKHWESALALIAQNVSPQQFDTWFKPIVFESFNDETKLLVLRVPSSFVYEYIEEHYIDLLSRVLFSAFGQRIRLTYRVVVDSEHKKTQDIEPTLPKHMPRRLPRHGALSKKPKKSLPRNRSWTHNSILTKRFLTILRAIATSCRVLLVCLSPSIPIPISSTPCSSMGRRAVEKPTL